MDNRDLENIQKIVEDIVIQERAWWDPAGLFTKTQKEIQYSKPAQGYNPRTGTTRTTSGKNLIIAPLTTGGNTRYVVQKPGDPKKDPSILASRGEINHADPGWSAAMSRLEKGSPEIVNRSAAARKEQQAIIASRAQLAKDEAEARARAQKLGDANAARETQAPPPIVAKPKPAPVVAKPKPVVPVAKPAPRPAPKPERTYNVGDYGSLTKSQINQKYKQLSGDEAVKFGKAANQAIYKWNESVESGPILPGEKGKRVFPKGQGQEPKPTGAKLPPLQNAGYEPEGELTEKMIYDIIIEYLVSNGHAEDLHEAHYLIERHDVDSLVRIVESCGCEHEEMEDEGGSNKKKKKKVSEQIEPTSEVERHPDGSMTQQTIDKKTRKKGPPIKLDPPGDGTNGTRLTIPFSNSAPGAEQGLW